ncbi:two-component regulator propeller domain-containing protein [Flavobacterium sp. RHBU_3]|uniref:two-component regulator propeller domain-containing protein n=1 Tax=Flavobacterium sp. RHBU_3 TaxID=3391184 RepID=UPI003984651D
MPKIKVIIRLFSLILSLACLQVAGQVSYTFHHLKTDNGLSNSNVKSLLKDSYGFLWVGTESGLNRYDGYGFKTYTLPAGVSSDISGLAEDGLGNIWIEAGGAYVNYKRDKDRFITDVPAFLNGLGITVSKNYYLYTDRKKNLWVFSGKKIFYYDTHLKKLKKFATIAPSSTISNGKTGDDGHSLYRVYDGGTLLKIDNSGKETLIQLPVFVREAIGKSDNRIFCDANGGLWLYSVKTDRIFYKKDAVTEWQKIPLTSGVNTQSNSIFSITEDAAGNVWIGTDHKGVFIYDKATAKVINLVHNPNVNTSIASNNVVSLYADNSGVVWMGHSKTGISYYHDSFHSIVNAEYAGCKDISAVFQDQKGTVWFGTDGYGLFSTSGGSLQKIAIPNHPIVGLTGDSKGRIWVGTYTNGLFCYDSGSIKHYTKENSTLASNDIWSLKEDRYGTLWIGTLGGGLQYLTSGSADFKPVSLPGTAADYVLDMHYDGGDKLYLGTTKGLGVVDIITHKQQLFTGNRTGSMKFKNLLVSTVFADSNGNIWLGHSNGIMLWDTKSDKLYYYSKENGLCDNIIRGFTEDNHSHIWVITSNGVSVLTTGRGEDGKLDISSRNFSTKDGLKENYFNNHAIFKLHTGDIIMGTTEGYTVINPNKMAEKNRPLAQVRFTSLSLGSTEIVADSVYNGRRILTQSIEDTKAITLRYNDKLIGLQFTTGDLINADKVHYAYKLEGFSSQWLPVQKNGVVFSSLAPGSYKLLVKAANSDGVWNNKPSVVYIEVLPPFYLSAWAILLYIVLLSGSAYYLVRRSKRKQQARLEQQRLQLEHEQEINLNEMKLRFFTNISHDLRTPLTLISAPLQALLGENLEEGLRGKLEIINKNTGQLMGLINSLLDFRKLDAGGERLNLKPADLVHFVKDKCIPFYAYAAERKISFTIQADVDALPMQFDPAKLERIVLNLVSNAFKYTPEGGTVNVSISREGDTASLRIADTGQGISDAHKQQIFERFYQAPQTMESTGSGIGLHITAEYVGMHGGTLTVTDNTPQGSVFTVSLPIQEAVEIENLDDEDIVEETAPLEKTAATPVLLLVDDNTDFCEFMAATLSGEYSVVVANNGKEAFEKLQQHDVNIVVSDVMMPVMNGIELCRAIKTNIEWSHIPVILLTARTAEEYEVEGLELGADDYLTKPFNLEILKLRIRKFLDWAAKSHRTFSQKPDISPSEITITSLDEQLIEKAIKTVEENIGDPDFTVEALGAAVGLSRSHLYKKLMSITGKGPAEFIRTVRLKRAKQLLEKSQMQVAEIAYAVGFNSPKRFTANFKNEFGLSPSDYLRSLKKD